MSDFLGFPHALARRCAWNSWEPWRCGGHALVPADRPPGDGREIGAPLQDAKRQCPLVRRVKGGHFPIAAHRELGIGLVEIARRDDDDLAVAERCRQLLRRLIEA